MKSKKKILESIGNFSSDDISLFESKCSVKHFSKNDILLKYGEFCNSLFYVVSGFSYQFSCKDVDEVIHELYIEDDWCFDYLSFVTKKPSQTIIKAYSDLVILEISVASLHELILQSPSFFQLGSLLAIKFNNDFIESKFTALERYNHLFSSKPQLFQSFPLKMIASYLKISPETLSRIRNVR